MEKKRCCKCKKLLSVECFGNNKSTKDGLYCSCRVCTRKYVNSHKAKKPKSERIRLGRKYWLNHKYNMTLKEYDEMFEEQDGVCYICGLPENFQRLGVDHNHKTGKIRKLLCNRCNRTIGYVEEDTELLKCMIQYIERLG